jgi:exopolysaccharide production protein ExoQ
MALKKTFDLGEGGNRLGSRRRLMVSSPPRAHSLYGEICLFVILTTYFAGGIDIFWRQSLVAVDFTDTSGDVATQVFLFLAFTNAIYVAARQRIGITQLWRSALPVLPLLMWAAVSVIWSLHPDITIRRSVRLWIEFSVLLLLVLSISDPRRLLRVLFLACGTVTVLDMIAALAIPQSYTPIGFAGVHGHKNSAGVFCFFAIGIFAIGATDRQVSGNKLVARVALLAAFAILFLSQSKTPVGVLLISVLGVGIVHWIAHVVHRNHRIFFALLAILAFVVLGFALLAVANGLLDQAFGDSSLTGRDRIWRFVLTQFARNPAFGLGYGALWQSGDWINAWLQNSDLAWTMNQAHNGYLDVLAQLGVVGLVLLCAFMAVTFSRTLRYKFDDGSHGLATFSSYAVFVCVGTIFYNITESDLLRAGHLFWVQLIIVSSMVGQQLLGRTDTFPAQPRGKPWRINNAARLRMRAQ